MRKAFTFNSLSFYANKIISDTLCPRCVTVASPGAKNKKH